MTLIASQPDTDAIVDLLIARKETALSAAGWEGYVASGRGALMTDVKTVIYINRPAIKHAFPGTAGAKKRVLRAVERYDPMTEIIVLVSWADGSLTIRRYTPRLPPEAALLERAGTPGLPPMRQAMAGVWTSAGMALVHE